MRCLPAGGETFVFVTRPSFAVYRWTRLNNYFMLARSNDCLAFGGGGGSFGLWLGEWWWQAPRVCVRLPLGTSHRTAPHPASPADADLAKGASGRCDTFNNAPLAPPSSPDGTTFDIVRVEVWGFVQHTSFLPVLPTAKTGAAAVGAVTAAAKSLMTRMGGTAGSSGGGSGSVASGSANGGGQASPMTRQPSGGAGGGASSGSAASAV